jgi:hypothetical protein
MNILLGAPLILTCLIRKPADKDGRRSQGMIQFVLTRATIRSRTCSINSPTFSIV